MLSLYIILGIIAFYVVAGIIGAIVLNQVMFCKHLKEVDNPCFLSFKDYENNLDREEFSYQIDKKIIIGGYIYVSKTKYDSSKEMIILSPGYGHTHLQYLLDINFLCNLGYKVLAYDHYGTGLSSGKTLKNLYFSKYVMENLLNYIKEHNINENKKVILYGHSWGGYTVVASKKNDLVAKIISRSGFNAPIKAINDAATRKNILLSYLNPFNYLFNLVAHGTKALTPCVKDLKKNNQNIPTLVIYAIDDLTVSNANSLAANLRMNNLPNIYYIVTQDGGHNSLLSVEGQKYHKTIVKEYAQLKTNEEKSSFANKLDLVGHYKLNPVVTKSIIDFLS